MSNDSPGQSRLIEYLEHVVEREDRATLAALRSSLREGHELEALRIVLPFVGSTAGKQREDDAALLAGLFALHPVSGLLSLAAALRRVLRDTGSDSVEGRFRALLSANRAELPTHLRHAVTLVASKNIAINWEDLYRAIHFWDHEKNFVRREWARAFWADDRDGDAGPEVPTSNTSAGTPS